MTTVAVIGAYGSAGSAVAETLAPAEEIDDLVLIDDGDPGGGLCILEGCMPSKEVLSAAAHRYRARHDDRLDGTPSVDLDAVVARKDDHTLGWAEHRRDAIHGLAERDDVRFLDERARFVDDTTIAVGGEPGRGGEAGSGERIDADHVVIATGSTVNVPDLPGLDEVDYHTSSDVLDATAFPDTAVVMGFGTVGLELVPYISEVGGTDVAVVEHDAAPIDHGDPAFGEAALDIYRDQFGVDVVTHAYEERVEATGDGGTRLHLDRDAASTGGDGPLVDGDVVEADELFLFTGRRPAIDGLGLEHTAIEPGPGWVEDTMASRDVEDVYVVGDANGKEPILHVAKEQGYHAAENVLRDLRGESRTEYEHLHHRIVFSGLATYPFVCLGMTEADAAASDREYVAVTREAASDGVFKTKDAPEGLATLVVDADDGTVLGYQGLHLHADVMAKTMQVVLENGMTVYDVPDRAYHPTTPEIVDGLLRDAKDALAD